MACHLQRQWGKYFRIHGNYSCWSESRAAVLFAPFQPCTPDSWSFTVYVQMSLHRGNCIEVQESLLISITWSLHSTMNDIQFEKKMYHLHKFNQRIVRVESDHGYQEEEEEEEEEEVQLCSSSTNKCIRLRKILRSSALSKHLSIHLNKARQKRNIIQKVSKLLCCYLTFPLYWSVV